MAVYRCILSHRGFVQENFMREGESKKEVLSVLKSFCFGKWTWYVELESEYQDDDDDDDDDDY